jgi:hypothetical protein
VLKLRYRIFLLRLRLSLQNPQSFVCLIFTLFGLSLLLTFLRFRLVAPHPLDVVGVVDVP